MRSIVTIALVLGALGVLVSPPAAAYGAGGSPTAITYATVACGTGWADPSFWNTGHDGQIEHASAVLYSDVYAYDGGQWRFAGTEADAAWDVYNAPRGVEVFRGKFTFTSAWLGDFAGTFLWTENGGGSGGLSVGRSPDGVLWNALPGALDPAPYEPLPDCAAYRDPWNLTLLELTQP